MARKVINTKEETTLTKDEAQIRLKHLTDDYIENKDREAEYKKAASAQNTEIKSIMSELGIDSCEGDRGIVTLSERKTEDFIEDKLIAFLKNQPKELQQDIIKTKEYVDFDALESALYHDKFNDWQKKEMQKCKDIKVTQVLRIKNK